MSDSFPVFDEGQDKAFAQRLVIMRFLTAAGVFVSLLYAAIFEFFLHYQTAVIVSCIFFVLYLFVFVFLKQNRVTQGKHFIVIIFLLQVGIHALYLFPKTAYFQIYYLVGVPLVYMLFTNKNLNFRAGYSIVSMVLLLVVELGGGFVNADMSINNDQIEMLKNSNVIMSLFILSITIYLFVNMMEEGEQRARELSITDHLTLLFNRRHFFYLARQVFFLNQRNYLPFSIIFIDIDNFKETNEVYGHDMRDKVLIKVANILKENTRNTDIVARFGNEEFVILFPDTKGEQALEKAEVIRMAILEAQMPANTLSTSLSIGVTEIAEDDQSINQLLKRVDDALHQAKLEGGNRIVSNFKEQSNIIP